MNACWLTESISLKLNRSREKKKLYKSTVEKNHLFWLALGNWHSIWGSREEWRVILTLNSNRDWDGYEKRQKLWRWWWKKNRLSRKCQHSVWCMFTFFSNRYIDIPMRRVCCSNFSHLFEHKIEKTREEGKKTNYWRFSNRDFIHISQSNSQFLFLFLKWYECSSKWEKKVWSNNKPNKWTLKLTLI